jgi:hypothetical protein
MGDYSVRSDERGNRLYIWLSGHFTDLEVKDAARLVLQHAEKFRSEFDVVNDIAGCRPFSGDANAILVATQALLRKMGMRRVVRVIGSALVAGTQIARNSSELGYSAATARTVAEAEKLLDR